MCKQKLCSSALRSIIGVRWTRKKRLFYYLTSFYPFLRVFKNHRKSPYLNYRNLYPKIIFFQKGDRQKFFREFKGSFIAKVRIKNVWQFLSYFEFNNSDENHLKSKYLPKYWVSCVKIMLELNVTNFLHKKKLKIGTLKLPLRCYYAVLVKQEL